MTIEFTHDGKVFRGLSNGVGTFCDNASRETEYFGKLIEGKTMLGSPIRVWLKDEEIEELYKAIQPVTQVRL